MVNQQMSDIEIKNSQTVHGESKEMESSSQDPNLESQTQESKSSPGPFKVIQSVLAAMIGIQSDKNRSRDFESGNIWHYIFVGIVMVAIFIFTIIAIVESALENAV